MNLIFTNGTDLTGATLGSTLTLTYGKHLSMALTCVDSDGADVDIAAKGMHQWKARVVSTFDSSLVLAEWILKNPIENTLQLELGVYAAELFNYIAGRETTAAILQLRGYSACDNEDALVYTIELGVVLKCNTAIKMPIDIQTTLLEELENAVVKCSVAAAKSETVETIITTSTEAARESQDAAASSAGAAALSANAAATSASNAATSESNAHDSEEAAASSATAAGESKDAAAASADAAADSASAAATSESNAATSESNAHDSAEAAANSATSAGESKDAAADSASAAATSESNAATSESNAHDSAEAAANSATAAGESKDAAAASADAAADSETRAQVWAEGADTDVTPLGGEHSSKGWATEAQTAASTAAVEAAEAAASRTAGAMGNYLREVAEQAVNGMEGSREYNRQARIWAEGTDEEVESLGGEHSSKWYWQQHSAVLMTPLTGTDVVIEPAKCYSWIVSGDCRATFSDTWRTDSLQYSEIRLSHAAGATLSFPAGSVYIGDEFGSTPSEFVIRISHDPTGFFIVGKRRSASINYLTFTATAVDSSVSLDRHGTPPSIAMEYHTGAGPSAWRPYIWDDEGNGIDIALASPGDMCQFRAGPSGNQSFSTSNSSYYGFTIAGTVQGSGSIMTLLDAKDHLRSMAGIQLYSLFYGQTALVSPPEFPATVLSTSCYSKVFLGSGITTAPYLPATEVASDVTAPYENMYEQTSALQDAGELPILVLGNRTFDYMYISSCVTQIAVKFKAWRHDINATRNWFYNAQPYGVFTCPAELPIEFGSNAIPWGWRVSNGLTTFGDEELLNACYHYSGGTLRFNPDFRACLDQEELEDYCVDGKTYWVAGTPLPNPHRPDLGDHYKVTSLTQTFRDWTEIRAIDISHWDTSQVTNMFQMVRGCSSLTSLALGDTSQVTNMQYMCSGCSSLTSLALGDTSQVTNMMSMCWGCSSLTSLALGDTSQVTNMMSMCNGCSSLTSLALGDTSQVTNMMSMCQGCSSLTSLALGDTPQVTNMEGMCWGCSSLTSLALGDTSKVTNMQHMCNGCSSLTSLALGDTSKVTNMGGMCQGCSSLTSLALGDTSQVTNMMSMCNGCTNLESLTLGNTSSVENMSFLCFNCKNMTLVDMSLCDLALVTDTRQMFQGCIAVVTAYGRTQEDCDKLNASTNKPNSWQFVVHNESQEPSAMSMASPEALSTAVMDPTEESTAKKTMTKAPNTPLGIPIENYANIPCEGPAEASLTVTIEGCPEGQWSLYDGAIWEDSGEEIWFTVGTYRLTYKPVPGYITPQKSEITLASGDALTATGTYTRE